MIPYDVTGIYDEVCEWTYLRALEHKPREMGCVPYMVDDHGREVLKTLSERQRAEILNRKR